MSLFVPLPVVLTEWVLLVALAALVIVAYRQLAFLLDLASRAAGQGGLDIGERPPEFDYRSIFDPSGQALVFRPGGQLSALLFVEPSCISCAEAVMALQNQTRAIDGEVPRSLVVTTATAEAILQIPAFRQSSLDIALVDSSVFRLYGVPATPFMTMIGSDGTILASKAGPTETDMSVLLASVDEVPRESISEVAAIDRGRIE